jgi:hypothetical protein
MMCAGMSDSERNAQQPAEVYGFCDPQGMFHAFEGPEGKRLVMAMKGLEEKVLAQVEKSLAGIRQEVKQTTVKSEAASWMLRNIVAEQKDLSSRVDELSTEAFESRSDLLAQLDEISREALESRADLIARTDEISQEALEARIDNLASLEDLEKKIDASVLVKDLDENREEEPGFAEDTLASRLGNADLELLDQQRDRINDLMTKLEAQVDQAKVTNLLELFGSAVNSANNEASTLPSCESTSSTTCSSHEEVVLRKKMENKQTALDLDLADGKSSALAESRTMNSWSAWSSPLPAEISYSSKKDVAENFDSRTNAILASASAMFTKTPSALVAPFNVHRPRPLARMTSSQSMPMLAPLV